MANYTFCSVMVGGLLVGLLGACGDSGSSSSGAGGGGTGGAAATTSSTGGSSSTGTLPTCTGDADPALECMAPALCDHPVELIGDTGPAPSMSGGTVTDGTYLLTAYTRYESKIAGPLGGATAEEVIVISGSDIRGSLTAGGSAVMGYAGVLDTSGGTFKVDNTCPVAGPDTDPDPYTATANEIQVLTSDPALLVYTRTQ